MAVIFLRVWHQATISLKACVRRPFLLLDWVHTKPFICQNAVNRLKAPSHTFNAGLLQTHATWATVLVDQSDLDQDLTSSCLSQPRPRDHLEEGERRALPQQSQDEVLECRAGDPQLPAGRRRRVRVLGWEQDGEEHSHRSTGFLRYWHFCLDFWSCYELRKRSNVCLSLTKNPQKIVWVSRVHVLEQIPLQKSCVFVYST